jgi:hypothetical protein
VLVPSRVEPLGNTAVEAFAQRPLVALRVPGLTGIAEDGRTRPLVPPVDPAALADAIARFLENSGTRRRAERPTRPSRRPPPGDQYAQAVPPSAAPGGRGAAQHLIPPGELGTVITAMDALPEPAGQRLFGAARGACSSSRQEVRRPGALARPKRGWTLTPKRCQTAASSSADRRPDNGWNRCVARTRPECCSGLTRRVLDIGIEQRGRAREPAPSKSSSSPKAPGYQPRSGPAE